MKRRRIAWILLALGLPLAGGAWALGTQSGAESVTRALAFGLDRSGVGQLELVPTQPLIRGIHAGPGRWSDASGQAMVAWESMELSRPRYHGGGIYLDKLRVDGLIVNLPIGEDDVPSNDENTVSTITSALAHNWLSDIPGFALESLQLNHAQLRQRTSSGLEDLVTITQAQLAARWDTQSATVEIQSLDAQTKTLLDQASVSNLESSLQWHPNAPTEQTLKGHLRAKLHVQPTPDVKADASVQLQISDLRNLSLSLDPRCDPCGPLPQAWGGELKVHADALAQHLSADTQFRAPQQELKAQLTLSQDKRDALDLAWSSQDLSKLLASLQGQSHGKAQCQGDILALKADCLIDGSLHNLRPGTQAKVQLQVNAAQGGPVQAQINKLWLQAFDQQVETQGPGATLTMNPDGSATLKRLELHTKAGRSSLKADATLSANQDLHVDLQAKRWELALLSSFVPGLDLQGRLDLDLQAQKQAQTIRAEAKGKVRGLRWQGHHWGNLALEIRHRKKDIRANARLSGRPLLKASLRARIPSSMLLAPGHSSGQTLNADLRIHTLSQNALRILSRQQDLFGTVQGKLQVQGPLHALDATADLHWARPGWRSIRRDALELKASLNRNVASLNLKSSKGPRSRIALQTQVALSRGPELTAIRWNQKAPIDFALQVSSLELAPIAEALSLPSIRGRVDAKLKLAGAAHQPKVQAWLSAWRPGYTTLSAKDLTLSLGHEDQRSTLELVLFRGKGRIEAEAEVPLRLDLAAALTGNKETRKKPPSFQWQPHKPHRVDLRLRTLDAAALSGILDLPESLQAHGDLHAQGTLGVHRIWGALQAQSQTRALRGHRITAHVDLNEKDQHLRLDWTEQNKTVLAAKAKTQGSLPGLIAQPQAWTQLPATIAFEAKAFDLSRLEPWLPQTLHEPAGRLSAKVRGQGKLASLQWQGQADIRNGGVAVVPLQQRVSKLRARFELDNKRLRIRRFTAKAGPGTLQLKGSMGLQAPAQGQLSLKISRVPLRLPGVPHLELSALLDSTLKLSPKTLLVDSKLKKGKVQVLELLTADVQSIPTNANVRFSDEIKVQGPRHVSGLSLPKLQLNTRIVDPVNVQGPMIATQWGGFLNLTQTNKGFVGKGKIRATPNGTFDVLGNHFVLERGSLEFTQDQAMLPYLDMRARTQVDGDEISVTAQGPANKPRLAFESSANASREEIVSALITGSSGRNEQSGNQMMARAVSALLAESGTPINRVAKRLGVDNLRLSFGESLSDTIVSAGSWVSPKVYLESRIRAQAPEGKSRVEGHVRYNFQENWVLEGYVGDRNAGGGGIWWHRPPRSRKKTPAPPTTDAP